MILNEQLNRMKLLFEHGLNNNIILYHGSDNEHLFNGKGRITNGTFFSPDYHEASSFGNNVYQVTLKPNLRLLDTNNINDCQLIIDTFGYLIDTYDNTEYYHANDIKNHPDNWEMIENTPDVLNWISNNYDGVWLFEGGVRNLLLFSPINKKLINIVHYKSIK